MNKKKEEDSKFLKILFRFYNTSEEKYMVESCWATRHKENFQLENIPFYMKLYAYEDIVKAELIDEFYEVKNLIKASGNSTIRIYVFDNNIIDIVKQSISDLGCDCEISRKESLIAVNIPSGVSFNKVKSFLDKGYNNDVLDYEEACISEVHQNGIS